MNPAEPRPSRGNGLPDVPGGGQAGDGETAAVAALLERTGAHRRGHFVLTTGLHSDEFFLLAQAFQYPEVLEQLGAALAAALRRVLPPGEGPAGGPAGEGGAPAGWAAGDGRRPVTGDRGPAGGGDARPVGAVVGPAMGGVLLAHAVARVLKARSLFAEKDDGGAMRLKRGFRLEPGEPVVVVEDAVTTGGSVRKTMDAVAAAGGRVVAVGAVVDRSGGGVDFGVPFVALLSRPVAAYPPDRCPLCRQGVPLVAPKRR